MTKRLIRVFDNNYNFVNVVVPLSMDFDEVIYIYHHDIDNSLFHSCSEILHKYKENIKIEYRYIKSEESEVSDLIIKDSVVDISAAKYLSAFLFEKAINKNNKVVYYDDEESVIKCYNDHTTLVEKVFSLTIEDMVKLGGGTILTKQMHEHIDLNDTKTVNAVVGVVESNISKYSMFINFVQKVNSYVSNRKIGNNAYRISEEIKNKIIYDDEYKKIKKYNLFTIEGDIFKFMNSYIEKAFSVSGTFLENYLYIKLAKSNKFDQVLMSTVIDFSSYYNRYPIVCEIDCLAIKNNHLLFISCKSNKVDTDDLNEIKIHNTIFGNDLSEPVICTIDDLSSKSPAVYLKARELKIAVVDRTSFMKKTLVADLESIIYKTYKYERV